jgi:hypothetical protein
MEYIQDCNEHILNTTVSINTNRFININVIVDKADYGNYLHYQISCANEEHIPLFKDTFHLDDSIMYNVVSDNVLIRKMLDFLCMADEELETYSGNTRAEYYRTAIIKFLDSIPD